MKKRKLDEIILEQRKNLSGGKIQMENASAKPFVITGTSSVTKLENATTDQNKPKPETDAPMLYKRPTDGYMTTQPQKKRTDYVDIREFKLEKKRKQKEDEEKREQEAKAAETAAAVNQPIARKFSSIDEILKNRGITPPVTTNTTALNSNIPPRPVSVTTTVESVSVPAARPISQSIVVPKAKSTNKPAAKNAPRSTTAKKKKMDEDLLKKKKNAFFDDLN